MSTAPHSFPLSRHLFSVGLRNPGSPGVTPEVSRETCSPWSTPCLFRLLIVLDWFQRFLGTDGTTSVCSSLFQSFLLWTVLWELRILLQRNLIPTCSPVEGRHKVFVSVVLNDGITYVLHCFLVYSSSQPVRLPTCSLLSYCTLLYVLCKASPFRTIFYHKSLTKIKTFLFMYTSFYVCWFFLDFL